MAEWNLADCLDRIAAIRGDEDALVLTVLGRGSVCINTGGGKVFPEEVEEVIKRHRGVVADQPPVSCSTARAQ